MTGTPVPRISYRLNHLVEASGQSLWSIRKAIADGELKAKRNGRSVLVLADEAERWLKSLEDA